MSEQLLTILKICLLALLYLFFLRVLRSVWVEIKGAKQPEVAPAPSGAPVTAGNRAGPTGSRAGPRTPSQLTVVEPTEQRGRSYPLTDELTLGRAFGCSVALEDTYASQIHARLNRDGDDVLVEDLGSTNGTYINRERIAAPTVLRRGDTLRVGNTVLELT